MTITTAAEYEEKLKLIRTLLVLGEDNLTQDQKVELEEAVNAADAYEDLHYPDRKVSIKDFLKPTTLPYDNNNQ